MLNLEWYRTFKAIYERGTLTGAAESLLITQPGVSQQLSSLEAYMGVQLFERKPRRMLPTPNGIQLYNQIEEAVAQLEKTEDNFKRKTLLNRPKIKIGMYMEVFHYAFSPILSQLEMDVEFLFGETEELQDKLFRKQLDLLITTDQSSYKDIKYTPFYKEELLLINSKDLDTIPFNQLIYEKKMDEAEKWLSQQDWYAYSHKMETIKSFWSDNFKKRPYFKPRYVIPNLNAILDAIQHNNGLCLLPFSMCKDLIEKKEIKELWQGVKTTYSNKYFAIQTQSINLKQAEEIIQIITNNTNQ
ncbi:LysR family transcriptional regulator [Labilibaculum antarcticum]|uniref:LysR family transcriptional regulator n=1 Tax=Labilibaculum antarcticum TaxID=1717717 RepID=A0A1Y1CP43_9BACT|nr:LysR family transcriptional regulator [Labilibaculum antarcticum]BAX81722.1 LysR family transcriptional regulator [Labilibaculum antarcticum]